MLKVNDGSVVVKEKASEKEVDVPFGLAVWSTGLGTRPVISKYMEKIGQVPFCSNRGSESALMDLKHVSFQLETSI